MRILKIIMITSLLCVVGISSFGCTSESDLVSVSENQTVTVQRGDLTIDITAVGNLALSRTEDLAFEVAGTVEEVLVEEGDNIEEGQVLARLDTLEWEEYLETLENTVTAAEDKVTVAEGNVTTTERQVLTKEYNLLQAEINLRNSEIALAKANGTYEWPDPDYETPLESAQADVDDAERLLRYVNKYDDGTPKWDTMERLAKEGVAAAEQRLKTLQNQTEEEVAVKELQVQLAQGGVEDAQKALEDAQQGIADAQEEVEDAQKEVEDAQEELDEELNTSLEIIAPFDGFIIKVNVEGGDEVTKGTVAVRLADPTKFEAELLVSEMDIFQVKLGGEAWVQVDAMPGMSLPAEVTHISPTATIQQGVVNYKVTVEIQSPESVRHQRQETRQEGMPDISSGELPERLREAIEAGLITQEQAEEMLERIQEGQMPFLPGGGQIPTMLPEDFELREGLTVTVSIIIQERKDVLLVPNQAIIYEGRETYVQVLEDGIIEQRPVKTGLSDWQYTEITEGLSEGEKVVVPQGTTTTPTTPQPGGRMQFFPGGGPH